MIVKCQQQDIFKIRDKIPGHGPQEAKFTYHPLFQGTKYVYLSCGCSISVKWFPRKEQQSIELNTPELIRGNNGIRKLHYSKFKSH